MAQNHLNPLLRHSSDPFPLLFIALMRRIIGILCYGFDAHLIVRRGA
jgi:hypothetical protein